MAKFRIWRTDGETSFADVEATDEDAVYALLDEGDDSLVWQGSRYSAEYDVDELTDA